VNVVIALLIYLFTGGARGDGFLETLTGGRILPVLLEVNVIMVLFNLIPAFPMDGGRVLRALLAFWMPYAKATSIASGVGQLFALVFGIIGLFGNPMLLFIALFVFLAASEERALVQSRVTLSGLPVHAAMVTDFQALDVRDPLQRAVDLLMAGAQQDFPVLDQGRPVGMLTRADLVRALQQRGPNTPVGDVIGRDEEWVDASEPLEQAVQRMRERSRSSLPVVQHGGLVGLITLENVSDLLLVRDALRRHSGAQRA
jgi:CBS domain-containing protein